MEGILEKINTAGLALLDTLAPAETYRTIVEEAIRLVDAEYGSILLAKEGKLLRAYASDDFFNLLTIRKGGTIEEAFKNKKLIVNNIIAGTKVDLHIREKGIKSVILIPLVYRNKSIGVLSVLSLKREHFTKKQVRVLRIYGSMASSAIKKAELYSEIKKALEIRDMFISMAAHELRTPLTSISGYIQLLYSKMSNKKIPEGKWVKSLYEENKRMMHLVKDILEVHRLKAGQLQFIWQECDLDMIIKQGIKNISQHFRSRVIRFVSNEKTEHTVIGDSERLLKVFYNLLDNAFKYSLSTMPVELTLGSSGNYFKISIKDYGKGIAKKDLPHIFEGQHIGDGGEEGIGFGLYFVDNVIRQHKGSVNIRSKLEKGTLVTIKLPKANYKYR